MTLVPGTKLGPYEIAAPAGAGGMGEVYRARDTKLGRDVALKVLPEAFAADTERMARFEREAKVLASLSHPHIASIFGSEDSGKIRALVMELVEGPTLAERIKQGAIPLEEALPIARQIAEALEYAHERGIIHRDLKPSNVKVAPEGTAKILDFGLAKALEGDATTTDISNSPTLSAMATRAGVLLGTAAYMSPEQAKGKSVDRRSDIWAFGVVLFEMLSGRRLFIGETTSDTLAAVIRAEPDWNGLPAATPLAIRNLLRRCLNKDPRQRLQSIGDARIIIDEFLSGASQDASSFAAAAIPTSVWRRALPWAVAAAAIIIAALFAIGYVSRTSRPAPESFLMASIVPPPGVFQETLGRIGVPQIAPDGRSFAFIGCRTESASSSIYGGKDCSIWLQPLDSTDAHEVPGTSGGYSPFWSPDGRNLAFFADGKLKRVPTDGGPVQIICDAEDGRGGSWGSSGTIIFAATRGSPIFRVSPDGGAPVAITRSTPAFNIGEVGSHRWPHFLPDGQHFLYNSSPNGSCSERSAMRFASLDGKQDVSLMSACSTGAFAAGHLIYWRDGNLVAQPFNPRNGVLSGTPVAIVGHVAFDALFSLADFSASADGKLVYVAGMGNIGAQLIWYDRAGKMLGTLGGNDYYQNLAISPDGSRVAADAQHFDGAPLLILDARGTRTLATLPGASGSQTWSADGRQIYFTSNTSGSYDIFVKNADGSGDERNVVTFEKGQLGAVFPAASPDGKFLAYASLGSSQKLDIYTVALKGDLKPRVFVHSSGDSTAPSFSPDSKWLAYESTQSGRNEVYITPFPAGGAQYQISTNGGERPVWRRDGKEIFYRENLTLMAVQVEAKTGAIRLGAPKSLFEVASRFLSGHWYDVSPDGRFLVNGSVPQAQGQNFGLIVNWPAKLSK